MYASEGTAPQLRRGRHTFAHCFRRTSGNTPACPTPAWISTWLLCAPLTSVQSGPRSPLPSLLSPSSTLPKPEEPGYLPDIQLLPKHEVVVEVSNGPVHSIAISHLHHGSPRLAFHEFHLEESSRDQHHCPAVRDPSPVPSKSVRRKSTPALDRGFHFLTCEESGEQRSVSGPQQVLSPS